MKSLINRFPREIGFPKRMLASNKDEFYKLLNKYNGIKTVFYSVYDCDEHRTYDKCVIDKLFFDFDGADALEDMKSFHAYLIKKNIKHLMLFSGSKGFHMYVFTKEQDKFTNSKRDVVYNAQMFFIRKLKLNADEKILGDIARFGRVPNTRHLSSNLFCIPITEEDLDKGLQFIKEKAKKQQFTFVLYGSELVDLNEFDRESRKRRIEMPECEYKCEATDDKIVKLMPPCVRLWLEEPLKYCKNDSRFFFALYCRDMGIPNDKVDEIAKKYWSGIKETNGHRSKYREFVDEKAIFYASKSDRILPSCQTLFQKGLCPGKCSLFRKNVFPIYK